MSEQEELLEISKRLRALHHAKHNAMHRADGFTRRRDKALDAYNALVGSAERAMKDYENICAQLEELTPVYNTARRAAKSRHQQ